jgi:hypothetical protein
MEKIGSVDLERRWSEEILGLEFRSRDMGK